MSDSEGYPIYACPVQTGCYCDGRASSLNPWKWSGLVDTVFCVCPVSRNDLFAHSVTQFHRVGLCTKILYYRPAHATQEELSVYGVQTRDHFEKWESHRFVTWYARVKLESRR